MNRIKTAFFHGYHRMGKGPHTERFAAGARFCAYLVVAICPICGIVLPTGGCQQPQKKNAESCPQTWDQVRGRIQYQVALQQYNSGRPEEAARSALQAVALNPGDAQAYILLCRSRIEIADWTGAREAISAAREAGVDDPMLIYLEGVFHEQRGDTEAALAMYQQARQRQPDHPDFITAEAELLVARGAPDAALDLVRPFVGRGEVDATLDALAARLAVLVGETELADWAYRSALRKAEHPLLSLDYARFLMHHGRFTEARSILEPLAVTIGDDHLRGCVARSLARCQLALNDSAAAFRLLEPHVRVRPDDDEAQLLFATAATLENRDHAALRASRLILDRNPRQTDALLIQAIVHRRLGHADAAKSALESLLRNNPSDPAALRLARLWELPGNQPSDALAADR